MIRFDNVSKRYANGGDALSDIAFEIGTGEMVFVTGHSGAGKSTLIKLLALIERPTRGQIMIDGEHLATTRGARIAAYRQRLGLVFQDYRLLEDRSVADNVALPLKIAGCEHAELQKRVRAALDLVGLGGRDRVRPSMLSGGEQQRVGIARAIVARPALIVADEPTGNLDPQLASEIMQLFVALAHTGSTILVASHDLHLIQRMKKRVLVLDKGRLIDDFRPGQRA
ncbi:MAG: cell division ATP-binding protein FtsE [Rhodanobacteraceae bacterium]|nr:cell division ATP-binding protein FtsE [Rhodanobacteraceae bacterium]MBK7043644.1 cell division ATP-binding protein FtsE [Rhodanobacteraceae bacterium]MBP9155411.1 cell division ATP-binding protein FtsE [Xanthomonadales bacterium]HQW80835.1 cell division ATP-binding protein FtsE [Pseudomonadota bacterium]